MTAKKVLCIEDEVDMREDIAEFLRSEDFEVIEADNGQNGLELFHKTQPDIVLCDVKMPIMSGFEMLERINYDSPLAHPLCPFIFLTAWADQDHCLTGKGLGCDDYLIKPVDFDVLLITLHSRLKLWEKMKNAGEKKLNHFRHEMLSVLTNHLKNPMHSVISYADMMNHNDAVSIEEFKAEVQGAAKKNITMIQNIMDSIMLAMDEQTIQMQSLSIENLIWEALVAVKGYDSIEQHEVVDYLNGAKSINLLADHDLMLKLLRNLIQESKLISDGTPYISCEKSRQGEVDLVIASSKRRAQDTSRWVVLAEDKNSAELDELMQFRAVSLIHAQSILQAHEGLLRIDVTNVYDPVYKLRLKAA